LLNVLEIIYVDHIFSTLNLLLLCVTGCTKQSCSICSS